MGLASMAERASAAGGALTIRSGESGTLVRMTVPVGGDRWRSPSPS
jgi:signal transduction histidine kinase